MCGTSVLVCVYASVPQRARMRRVRHAVWMSAVLATASAQLTYKMVHGPNGRRMVATAPSTHRSADASTPLPSPSPTPTGWATLSDEQVKMLFNEAERRCDEAFDHVKREADERVEMATDVATAMLKNMWTSMLFGTLCVLGWTASLTLANLWLLRNLKKVTDALTFGTGEGTKSRLMLRSQDGNDDLEEEDDALAVARRRNVRKDRTTASGVLAEAAANAAKTNAASSSASSQRRKGKHSAKNHSDSDDGAVLAE